MSSMTSGSEALRPPTIVYSDESHVTGTFANVVISSSVAEPNRGYLDNWFSTCKRLIAAQERAAALIVIDSTAKPPGDAVRVEINGVMTSLGKGMIAIAVVVEGKGFVAAAKRSAVSMIALLARFPFPMRIFGEVIDASSWLAQQIRAERNPAKVEANVLVAATEAIRREAPFGHA